MDKELMKVGGVGPPQATRTALVALHINYIL